MDADTLRLILIVVGALLLILLYLWERRRARRNEEEPYEAEELDEDQAEPHFGRWDDAENARDPGTAGGSHLREGREAFRAPEQPALLTHLVELAVARHERKSQLKRQR